MRKIPLISEAPGFDPREVRHIFANKNAVSLIYLYILDHIIT